MAGPRNSRSPAARSLGARIFGRTPPQHLLFFRQPPPAVLVGSGNKCSKQRMWLERFGLEFRVELAAEEPRVIGYLADFHVNLVRRFARNSEPRGLQLIFVLAIEF